MARSSSGSWLGLATLVALAGNCRNATGADDHRYPVGYARLLGRVAAPGGAAYSGPIFVACVGHGQVFAAGAGRYAADVAWPFPEGVPAAPAPCEVRAGQPPFATATAAVPFAKRAGAVVPVALDVGLAPSGGLAARHLTNR